VSFVLGTWLLKADLRRIGWTEAQLAQRRKGDPQKLEIAFHLGKETTMTLAWIAEHLQMGTKTHLSHLVYSHNRRGPT
jgi:hypothetical protein